eukprot:TRINITY_DN105098_c1_g1_i1.p4 TRINITY_DN105098_c1_g1~~TRINITY_DN105098_c1_g1_i1.p4  ORF type:complete len:215 (-),score=4.48 TRINITY_DN105098_c1_g1_i1:308-952(-)
MYKQSHTAQIPSVVNEMLGLDSTSEFKGLALTSALSFSSPNLRLFFATGKPIFTVYNLNETGKDDDGANGNCKEGPKERHLTIRRTQQQNSSQVPEHLTKLIKTPEDPLKHVCIVINRAFCKVCALSNPQVLLPFFNKKFTAAPIPTITEVLINTVAIVLYEQIVAFSLGSEVLAQCPGKRNVPMKILLLNKKSIPISDRRKSHTSSAAYSLNY